MAAGKRGVNLAISACSSTKIISIWREPNKEISLNKLNKVLVVALFQNETSTIGKANDDGIHELWGELTMIGVTKNMKLEVEFGGIVKDPWTNEKAGFSITGKIKRSEWGLVWNATIEAGGVLVSDEIFIICEVELTNIGSKDLIMEVIENKDEILDTM